MTLERGGPPQFPVWGPPQCGWRTAQFITLANGLPFSEPHPNRHWVFKGTLPGPRGFLWWDSMVDYLKHNGGQPKIHRVPHRERMEFLEKMLREGNPPAIFVRPGSRFVPFPFHWLGVGAVEKDLFFVFDDRVHGWAHNRKLPIGNTVWSREKLAEVWRGLSSHSIAVTFR